MIPSTSSTTSTRSSGRSTGSDLWAALGGLSLGLALSGALRWGPRHHRVRAFSVPFGLNLAALALLSAVFAAGTDRGGLGAVWESWLVPAGVALALGTLGFRFPRSVGLPVAVAAVALGWGVAGALSSFAPPTAPGPLARVQPLTDQQLVLSFVLRVDTVELPRWVPLAPRSLVRLRSGHDDPSEWWWSWAEAQGWARSVGAPNPDAPLKYGVYRLRVANQEPSWVLEAPALALPETAVRP